MESFTEIIKKLEQKGSSLQKARDKVLKEKETIAQVKEQISNDQTTLSVITPQIIELEKRLKDVESEIGEVGGIDYKK